jgi:hypothetical protein
MPSAPCDASQIGKYEEAETLNKRALSIRMKAHGTSHPDVGMPPLQLTTHTRTHTHTHTIGTSLT